MSTLVYNGIGLIRVQERALEREAVWHGPDYQYTRHRLTVRGVYNPEINAYNFAGGSSSYQIPAAVLTDPTGAVPVIAAVVGARRLALIASAGVAGAPVPVGPAGMSEGVEAPLTELAIRHQLMQPRQWLFFAIGNTPILVSPGVNQNGTEATTDAWIGPIPLSCDVVQISGTKTFLVDYAIETYINESSLFASTMSVILSHRWTKTESIDQDMYSTITTEGVAHFRRDRLDNLGVVPDDFRFYFFHPVPPRCQRIDWSVQPSEDGTAVAYRLVDRMTYLRIVPAGITRVEAFQTATAVKVSAAAPFVKLRTGGLFEALGSLVPMTKLDFTVRVWGTPASNRAVLESFAFRLIGLRLSAALTGLFGAPGTVAVIFGIPIPTTRSIADALNSGATIIRHDLVGTGVEVTVAWAVPMPNIFFNPAPGTTLSIADVRPAFPKTGVAGTDEVTGVLNRDLGARFDLFTAAYSFLRPDGLRVGTRASFTRQLVSAALGVPDRPPPLTPDPNNAQLPATLTGLGIPP